MKTCLKCGIEKQDSDFYVYRGKKPRVDANCKPCSGAYTRKYAMRFHAKLRKEVLDAYGSECWCCGEDEIKFLSIDHKLGGGVQHRKKLTEDGTTLYLWLRKNKFPKGYQVLCHNCNLAKGFYGSCPHKY